MTMKESGPCAAARLPQLPGPPLMMISHQIWWRSGSIISDPDWSHLVPRASWLHCSSVSKLLVLTTVARRCAAVFFFFYLFRSCSEKHSATAKQQNWPQTEISMAVVDVWHSSGVLSHEVYEKKRHKAFEQDIRSRHLFNAKSSSEVWNWSQLPTLLWIFCLPCQTSSALQ